MKSTKMQHVEIARLQDQIQKHLGLDSNSLVFDFKTAENIVILDLITINPRHEQSFLFCSFKGTDKLDALKKVYEYVLNYKQTEDSYTIQWTIIGKNELHTSYFRAKNMYEVLDKFYYNRDINSVKVFSVVLNPIS